MFNFIKIKKLILIFSLIIGLNSNNLLSPMQGLDPSYIEEMLKNISQEKLEKLLENIPEDELLQVLENSSSEQISNSILANEINKLSLFKQANGDNEEVINSLENNINNLKITLKHFALSKNDNQKILSKNTLLDLNIYNLNPETQDYSLLDVIDQTITPFGKLKLGEELNIKRKTISELNSMVSKINTISNNENIIKILDDLLIDLNYSLNSYFQDLEMLNDSRLSETISENLYKISNSNTWSYLKPSIGMSIKTPANSIYQYLTMQLMFKTLGTFKSLITKNERIATIKNSGIELGTSTYNLFYKKIKDELKDGSYKNPKLLAYILGQFGINKFISTVMSKIQNPSEAKQAIIKINYSITNSGLPLVLPLVTKIFNMPEATIFWANLGINSTITGIKTFYNLRKDKKNLTENIWGEIYNIKDIINKLESIMEVISEHDELKSLVINIKALINPQNEEFNDFIQIIKNIDDYKDNKNLKLLYEKYNSIFIQMNNPAHKDIINKAFNDIANIDVLLSKAKLCRYSNFSTPNYKNRKGKPFINFEKVVNPMDLNEDPEINNFTIDNKTISGLNSKKYEEQFKSLAYNIILSHIGIVRAERCVITPIDNIYTTFNIQSLNELTKDIIEKKSYQNEKSLMFINKTKSEKIAIKNKQTTTFNSMMYKIQHEFMPKYINSYFLFS